MEQKLTSKLFNALNPFELLQTKKVLHVNPTVEAEYVSAESILHEYIYSPESCEELNHVPIEAIKSACSQSNQKIWLNVDILNKKTIETVAQHFSIHPLFIEDILSGDQRPKAEETDNIIFCIMQMMYYNTTHSSIETEQLSIVLGHNYVLTFQDEAERDLFNPIREKLKFNDSKIRTLGSDYLCYCIIDAVVDQYFLVLEEISKQIEKLEEEVSKNMNERYSMQKINSLRKDLILFKRNVSPVRELVNTFLRSENNLIEEKNKRYFKDVYDHIIQANDLFENYRDVVGNIRDLYFNQTNLKMNHVMKFMAIVTTLLAPATVIGGIFGMNFDKIPYLHNANGFWIATILMVSVPIVMLWYFKKKGWY